MNKGIYIGSHVSMSGPSYYEGSVKEALSYGANTFMFYTGAPQNLFRLPIEKLHIEEGRKLIKEAGIDESKIIVHAPYILNIANQLNPSLYEMSKDNLINELRRVAAFGLQTLVLHPGSHVGTGFENGLESIIKALDEVLSKDNTNVKIALETMAGKGGEMCSTFEQIQYILSHIKYPERVGVCLDTCHINDSGMNAADIETILDNFDKTVGLKNLLCIHINDSKNPLGSHKDRHENIGFGELGFETLEKYISNPRLVNISKILETPYINQKPPYKKEIEMLLNNKFDPTWREGL